MIYLIGTGGMAVAYAKILSALNAEFAVIGRGADSSLNFEQQTGLKPFQGGVAHFLQNHQFNAYDHVIIATGTETLMPVLKMVLQAGVRRILIEKPAAISIQELLDNKEFLSPYANDVFVGYNRRFYASVNKAKEIIVGDGGLISMNFEFTEWAHKIEPLTKAPGVKENWFFANSTHVIDLAFFIAGKPKDWACYSEKGTLNWHNKSAYAGAGVTEKGALFTYSANWESAGRWGLDLMTAKRRIILRPLEKIAVQERGSIDQKNIEIDDKLDVEFKHGLHSQVKHFLESDDQKMCSLAEHLDNTSSVFIKMQESFD